MMTSNCYGISPTAHPQQGAVLIVGLIMLLLMTVVGLAAIRGSGMQELMAGNVRDTNLAFQAAEGALRLAEAVDTDTAPFDGTMGTFPDLNQLGAVPVTGPAKWNSDDWQRYGVTGAASLGTDLSRPPRYVVEKIISPIGSQAEVTGSGMDFDSQENFPEPEYFRASGWGAGGTDTAQAVVQSMIRKQVLIK